MGQWDGRALTKYESLFFTIIMYSNQPLPSTRVSLSQRVHVYLCWFMQLRTASASAAQCVADCGLGACCPLCGVPHRC